MPRLNSDGSVLVCADGQNIPWDAANNRPLDHQGDAWRSWERLRTEHGITQPEPYDPPDLPAPSFLARDLIAHLTADDFAAIETTLATSIPLRLLWSRLMAQGEAPISSDSEAFQQGWAGLVAALGQERSAAISRTLGIA